MPTPKTITAKIVVPEWAKWVATDKDGETCFFSKKPSIPKDHNSWEPKFSPPSEWGNQFFTTPPRNWRKTLRRVK